MSSFAPAPVLTTHHFEVSENDRGYWIAQDKEGLIGGLFRTQKDAVRFALFEAAGDGTCVKVISSPGSLIQKRERAGRPMRLTRYWAARAISRALWVFHNCKNSSHSKTYRMIAL